MVNTSKKLEDKLLELGETLASPPSAYSELYTLLDRIDKSLATVEQSPSASMWNALQPLLRTLTMKNFLRHPDTNVRVAVASCISEITRITAPEAPYDDDVMKEFFQMIVGAFGGLGDMSSWSFQKKVSILETVAKVRSCVVMLDLECDSLILDMFRHFLKTISNDHSENVFSSMGTIMTLVIEESEDISFDLLSCLLDTLKKDKEKEDVLSISQRLAKKVMGNCANKIRSCLVEFVQSTCVPLSEYDEVVASICEEDLKEANASGEDLEDDCKLSERTVSDELPQASGKLEQEVGCLEKVGTSADTSPIVATTNGTVQVGNDDSMGHPSSPKQKSERSRRDGKSKNAVTDQADFDNVESVVVKPNSRTDTKKAKDRKTNSSGPLTGTAVGSQVGSHQNEQMMTGRGKGHNKESDSSPIKDAPTKEAEPAASIDPEKKSGGSVASPTEPNSSRKRRGRRAGPKAAAKISDVDAAAEQPISFALKDTFGNSRIDGEATPLRCDEPKETEDIDEGDVPASVMSNSDVKSSRNAGKKGRSKRKVDYESSGRKQKSNNKKQKKEYFLEKDVDEDQSLKEMAASLKTPRMNQIPLDVSAKPKSRKKHALGTVDIFETLDRKKEPDESLVGSKIEVWWPEDKMFYEGVVSSYDPDTLKHEIIYSDGDVEVLLLKDERYVLFKNDSDVDGRKRKTKGSASQVGTESSSKDASKPRGRPRSGSSNVGKLSFHGSERLKKSHGKDATNDKAKTNKSGGKIKDGPVDETPKTSSMREESSKKPKEERKSEGKDVFNDKVETPKSSKKLGDEPADETANTSSNKSKRKSKGKDAFDDEAKTPKSGRGVKDDPADETPKSSTYVKKSKNETPKANTKSPRDVTPKTVNRIECEDIGKDKMPMSKIKVLNSTPKTGYDSRENTDFENMTGAKKRKRKGRR